MQIPLLRKAKADLNIAVMALGSDDEYDIQLAAFHVQQSIEKVLKGVIAFYGRSYTKTHEIASLLHQLPKEQNLVSEDLMEDIERNEATLTKWERVTRYDDPYLASRRLITELLGLAQTLYDEVSLQLEQVGSTAGDSLLEEASIHEMNLFGK